jgi:hypothetical protein
MLVLISLVPLIYATHPTEAVSSSYAEFLGGEFDGVSLTSDGKLILAPEIVERLDTSEAFVYAAVADKGGTVFLGTGNNGKIFRLSDGSDTKEWAKLEEAGVYALAVDSSNRLYAGTAPEGRVYRFDNSGKADIFFDPTDKYIWDLAIDSQDNVFVATGPRGMIYRVDPQGNSSTHYDSEDAHIVELEWDLDGNLLAGSASEGLLYRISSAGKAFLLYDSSLEEVKSVTVDRYGNVYAAVLSGESKPGEAKKNANSAKSAKPSSIRTSTVTVSGTSNGSNLEVYRIDKENLVETLYSSSDEIAFDLSVRDDGRLLIATGNKGRVLSVTPDRFVTLVAESGEEQVTQFVNSSKGFYFATSNLGRVFEMVPKPAKKGVYESKVLDAGVQALWGNIRWSVLNGSGAGVTLFTRSGNRKDPDGTWNEWSGPYQDSQGSQISSPSARYLQWKVEFAPEQRSEALLTDQNAVDLVSVSYMQRNVAPKVTSVTVHPPGVTFIKPPTVNPASGVPPGGPEGAHAKSLPKSLLRIDASRAAAPPRRIFVPGARSFSWKAADPNNDSVVFSLYLRAQGESNWIPVAQELSETYYTLDGISYPDGLYFLKVLASDRPGNPASSAQEDELVSNAFTIANSIPVVEWETPLIEGQSATIGFTASTVASSIYQVEFSLDGEEWQLVFPEDGIADSKVEKFNIRMEKLGRGPHTLRVRVVDRVGNLGTHSVQLTGQ